MFIYKYYIMLYIRYVHRYYILIENTLKTFVYQQIKKHSVKRQSIEQEKHTCSMIGDYYYQNIKNSKL